MEQNTSEWEQFRKTHLGSSDAPPIMGVSPWKTQYQLWEEKVSTTVPTSNYAMKRGHDLEPKARAVLERELGMPLGPKVLTSGKRSWMMASLDAISFDERTVAEIKCPGIEDHKIALEGHVPEKYIPQLQHQLEVCQLDAMYYFSFDGEKGVVIKVFRDEKYIKELIEKEEKFFECMMNFEMPPLTDRDFEMKCSPEWSALAQRWHELEVLENEKEEVRKRLIALCNGQNSTGGGIKVSKCTRKGNVDYSKVPELNGIDLELYRKKTTQYWRIS
jgi:putative phage-type endonuclease